MKYSTALTLFLACSPSAIIAAPVAQDATPALVVRNDSPQPQGQPQASPQTGPQGSSATGQKGQKSGNEGILDKVEKILKDVLGGLRKRGVVDEVGDAVKKTLDGTSKLVNGEQSGSQSGFSSQSSNPDAAAPPQKAQSKQKGDGDDDDDEGKDGGSGVSKFLGGRDSPIDPVTNEVSSVPKDVESLPKDIPASAPVKKSSTSDRDDDDEDHDQYHHQSSPESSKGQGLPSSTGDLSPEQVAAIASILNSGGAQKKPQVPGQDD
ncbi:hypothetical protein PISL3812_04243 [Talaromyces islandicus]|uniref:Uncharacterized protein n=1 Tax=Talaromyces islandicus TaxID=28573 RepID=A0A0U1LWR4_TALIS|nr:hypothetical protein PISL3812_04243 [Talaromyces islandicus]